MTLIIEIALGVALAPLVWYAAVALLRAVCAVWRDVAEFIVGMLVACSCVAVFFGACLVLIRIAG